LLCFLINEKGNTLHRFVSLAKLTLQAIRSLSGTFCSNSKEKKRKEAISLRWHIIDCIGAYLLSNLSLNSIKIIIFLSYYKRMRRKARKG